MVTLSNVKTLVNKLGDWFPEEIDFIVAGGCPRDIDNDKPVKDIDIFVNMSDSDRSVHHLLRRKNQPLLLEFRERTLLESTENYGNEDVGYVLDASYNFYTPVQFIFYYGPANKEYWKEYLVETFDSRICRIYWDKNFELKTTREYNKTKETKTFSLDFAPNIKAYNKSLERLKALHKKKYPRWNFYDRVVHHIKFPLSKQKILCDVRDRWRAQNESPIESRIRLKQEGQPPTSIESLLREILAIPISTTMFYERDNESQSWRVNTGRSTFNVSDQLIREYTRQQPIGANQQTSNASTPVYFFNIAESEEIPSEMTYFTPNSSHD